MPHLKNEILNRGWKTLFSGVAGRKNLPYLFLGRAFGGVECSQNCITSRGKQLG